MNCIECGSKSDVVDSRLKDDGVWRRRKCRECGSTWTTMEMSNPSDAAINRMLEFLSGANANIDQVFRDLKGLKSREAARHRPVTGGK